MNFSSYAELQSAIADELNRTDLTSAVTGFISLMESQVERVIRTREMIYTLSAFEVASEYEPLPADFLETRSFYINADPVTKLDFASIDELIENKMTNPGVGKPTLYTVIGDNFQFSKVPDTTYSAVLIYYRTIPRLSDTNTSNWLLTKHPDIYFYGSLLNSAPYLKEDARVGVWGSLYQSAIDALMVADNRAQSASNNLVASARKF